MKVGFSLKDIVFRENDREQLVTYETLDTLLVDLKKFGVNSIEIRKLVRQLDNDVSEKLNQSVQKIWDLGMEITVHGDLTGDIKGSKFEEVYPSMKYILENFRRYQEKLVVTLHALQEKRVEATRNPEQL